MRALTMIVSSSTFDQKLLMESRGPLQFTPLHMAARGGRDAACDYLIELGADVDCIDENGKKPSDLAKSNNKMKLAEKLLGMESNDMPELDWNFIEIKYNVRFAVEGRRYMYVP